MSTSIKKTMQDETRLGEYAATQPLSGVNVVTTSRVKGYSNMGFVRAQTEVKKAG